jgi:hypothetical protein
MPNVRGSLALVAVGCADVAVLAGLQPHPAALAEGLRAPHAWVQSVGADAAAGALCGAAMWCVAAWLAVGLLLLGAASVPGAMGRLARALARVLLPRAIVRLITGAAGLGVLIAPVAAGAAAPVPRPQALPSVPAPTWPTDPALPSPSWPTTHATGGTPGSAPPATAHPTEARTRSVTVRPGDSLWQIAARELGPRATPADIATRWPRWFAGNRPVIGDDPAVIQPGQILRAPIDRKETQQ